MTVVWPRVVVEERGQTDRWRDEGTDAKSADALTVAVGGILTGSPVDGEDRCSVEN